MSGAQSVRLMRVPTDVSLAMKPATSFAHLRSFNRHVMRGDSMIVDDSGLIALNAEEARRKRRRKGRKRAAKVNPVMAKHFPALGPDNAVVMNTGGQDQDDSVMTIGDGDSLGFSPGSGGSRGDTAPARLGKSRSSGYLGSSKRNRTRGSSRRGVLSASGSRLFDPRLTSSALGEIEWLPNFRKSISRLGSTNKKKAGGFGTGAMGGTLRLKSTTKLPENRPAFIPSGGAAAKRGVASKFGSNMVGTPYNALLQKRRDERKEAKARFLAGEFRRNNASQAKRQVMVESYLNSADEESLIQERMWIREKMLLTAADFANKKVGQAATLKAEERERLLAKRYGEVPPRSPIAFE